MRTLVFFAVFLFALPAFSFETLNYDCAFTSLPDVSAQLNAETNRRINDVALRQRSCSSVRLEAGVAAVIADPWFNNLEVFADQENIPKCVVPARKSVYRDFNFFDSPIGLMAGLKGVINIGGTHIGTDKISHFMTEGYQYYKTIRDGGTLTDILKQGWREENGIYGMATTGIRSYADMAANYRGFQFWSELTKGNDPYLACVNNSWVQRREFKWEDYVDASFDESINCNEYQKSSMEKQVDQRSRELQENSGLSPRACPFQIDSCVELVAKIKPAAALPYLLSPRCRDASTY